MRFGALEFFWLLIPVAIVFFFLRILERRRFLAIAAKRFGRKRGIRVLTRWTPKALWLALLVSLILYFANPLTESSRESLIVNGRVMCLVIDLSSSMRGTSLSRSGRSSFAVIQELSQVFVKRRAATDFVCLTVFGGRNMEPSGGEASIVRLPTNQPRILEASLKSIYPGMVGIYTSIGEGMLVTFFALLDQELRAHHIDRYLVREQLEQGDMRYIRFMVEAIGRMPNRRAVLFTDGKNNAGIEPSKVFPLYRAFGIKVDLIELESTSSTGLSWDQELISQEKIIRGVRETGGEYFFAQKVEDVEAHYDAIDRLERAEIKTTEHQVLNSHREEALIAAFILAIALAIWSLVFRTRP